MTTSDWPYMNNTRLTIHEQHQTDHTWTTSDWPYMNNTRLTIREQHQTDHTWTTPDWPYMNNTRLTIRDNTRLTIHEQHQTDHTRQLPDCFHTWTTPDWPYMKGTRLTIHEQRSDWTIHEQHQTEPYIEQHQTDHTLNNTRLTIQWQHPGYVTIHDNTQTDHMLTTLRFSFLHTWILHQTGTITWTTPDWPYVTTPDWPYMNNTRLTIRDNTRLFFTLNNTRLTIHEQHQTNHTWTTPDWPYMTNILNQLGMPLTMYRCFICQTNRVRKGRDFLCRLVWNYEKYRSADSSSPAPLCEGLRTVKHPGYVTMHHHRTVKWIMFS